MKQSKLVKGKTNIVGVTGGVGAGKSRVLGYLEEHCNCRIIFSDQVANDIKKKGYPAYDELVDLLGKEILGDDLEIDKAKMAKAIFADENLLMSAIEHVAPYVSDMNLLKGRLPIGRPLRVGISACTGGIRGNAAGPDVLCAAKAEDRDKDRP